MLQQQHSLCKCKFAIQYGYCFQIDLCVIVTVSLPTWFNVHFWTTLSLSCSYLWSTLFCSTSCNLWPTLLKCICQMWMFTSAIDFDARMYDILLFVPLFSLFLRLHLYVVLSLTFFLELKRTENASIWLISWEALYINIYIQYKSSAGFRRVAKRGAFLE